MVREGSFYGNNMGTLCLKAQQLLRATLLLQLCLDHSHGGHCCLVSSSDRGSMKVYCGRQWVLRETRGGPGLGFLGFSSWRQQQATRT